MTKNGGFGAKENLKGKIKQKTAIYAVDICNLFWCKNKKDV